MDCGGGESGEIYQEAGDCGGNGQQRGFELMMDISVIILTLNEACHIRRCIENVSPWVRAVFVVDCFSTDATADIARSMGAEVVQQPWPGNQAAQFNWALANLKIKTKWVLRLDADEYLTAELVEEIKKKLPTLTEDVTGVAFPRHHFFLNREIKHGVGRTILLRLFQYGRAVCEQRLMDEHIQLLEGTCVEFDHLFFDHNLSNLTWWTGKHNGYALRETVELLDMEFGLLPILKAPDGTGGKAGLLTGQAAQKRAKKMRYAKMPLFWRSALYFFLRYIVKGGFLDGKEGFLWHFLQGWWYRTLVDAKIWEIKRAAKSMMRSTAAPGESVAESVSRITTMKEAIVKVLRDEYQMNV